MRKLVGLVTVLLLTATLRAEAPFVDEPLDRALKDAATSNKLVMIDLFATWCAPCKALDQKTWPDKSVQAFLADHAIALRMDGEKETAVSKKYNSDESYPLILFIKPDGSEAGHISGFVTPEEFLKQAGDIIAKAGAAAPKAP